MGEWLQALKTASKKNKTPPHPTDKTDATTGLGVLSVLSVPERGENTNYDDPRAPSCVSFVSAGQGYSGKNRCPDRWRDGIKALRGEARADGLRFVEQWGEIAADLGWSDDDLFGTGLGCQGLILELAGRDVVALSERVAVIEADATRGCAYFCRPDPSTTTGAERTVDPA